VRGSFQPSAISGQRIVDGREPPVFIRRSTRRVVVGLLLLLAVVGLSGCTDTNAEYIQGDWFFSAPGVGGITSQTSVHTYWNFDAGTLVAHSCCKDRPGMSGDYRVVESEGDSLVLELFNMEGAGAEDGYQLRIVIDRSGEALSIQGVGPFSRTP
jgi:hypothetical protein